MPSSGSAGSPKSRIAGYSVSRFWQGQEAIYREVHDVALDMHTQRGKQRGRGIDHFLDEAAIVEPHQPGPDEETFKEGERDLFGRRQGVLLEEDR